ncbi:MAG: 4-hydroxyphenylpyruvate dioxygenase [Rhodocyclaceae bacterium]|nr:4-hydroxyphenylpyruvate dioxygenase [Rhodocyclaceae bacterium]
MGHSPSSAAVQDNPMGLEGCEFVEFAAPEPLELDRLFRALGFSPVARHRSKDVTLYRQGGINFILNAEAESFAQAYARVHGASICALALRVHDARAAANRAKSLGADVLPGSARPGELNIPAVRGIGGSLIYLVDRYETPASRISLYDVDFVPLRGAEPHPRGQGLAAVDHLALAVHPGRVATAAEFWERLFAFRQTAAGELASPCGHIRLRITEAPDAGACHGEAIQGIALAAPDIDAIAAKTAAIGALAFTIVQA